jgi:hypothetical protein
MRSVKPTPLTLDNSPYCPTALKTAVFLQHAALVHQKPLVTAWPGADGPFFFF